MIGSSDGKQYESPFDVAIGRPLEAPEKAAGASKSPAPTQGSGELHIDRSKDVPLAASALHKDGEMYGIAIDKDAPIRPEYDQYIHKHESDEFGYMQDLIKNGMQPGEAYHKAHDHITPMESARVQADLGEKGLEDYKQYWRDVASVSSQKENPDRHPDAHTTTFGLDEKELGRKFTEQREALFRGLKGAGIIKTDAQFQPFNPMQPGYSNPGGHGSSEKPWLRGAEGKWRQEISDVGSKLKTDAFRTEKTIDYYAGTKKEGVHTPAQTLLHVKPDTTLQDIFHHPELYESYPGFKYTPIHPVSKEDLKVGIKGGVDNFGHLYLAPGSKEAVHSVLLHEIQHLIQGKEGFTQGASPQRMLPTVEEALRRTGQDGWDKNRPSENDIAGAALEAYHHVAGEVESRNVQFRHKYPEAAEIFSPELTEDVPRSKQLNSPK